MNATQKIESKARALVQCGSAADLDEALATVVHEEPELYKESLGDVKSMRTMPPEVQAALDSFTPSMREMIERQATEIYLKGTGISEVDSLVMAIQQNPAVHLQAADASARVRPDTKEALKGMRDSANTKKGPWEKLLAIAAGYLSHGLAASQDEAWLQACEDNPALFQAYNDAKATQ